MTIEAFMHSSRGFSALVDGTSKEISSSHFLGKPPTFVAVNGSGSDSPITNNERNLHVPGIIS